MDPAKFLVYTNNLAAELALLSDAGHRQITTIETLDGPPCAAIIAVGPQEAKILGRVMGMMLEDPEYIAYRQARSEVAKANAVGALTPDRN